MPHHAGQRVQLVVGIDVAVHPRQQPLPQRWSRTGRTVGLGLAREPAQPFPVDVGRLVVQRDRHVERVPGDDDVGGPGVKRHAVERRVGLDEPAVLLGGEPVVHLRTRRDQPVQPRRELRQRSRQLRGLEHQQRADHLHPRRAALGPCADHDVALPEREAKPSAAVLVGGSVTRRRRRYLGHPTEPSHNAPAAARSASLSRREPGRGRGRRQAGQLRRPLGSVRVSMTSCAITRTLRFCSWEYRRSTPNACSDVSP